MATFPAVRVGVAAIVLRDSKVLIGHRKGSHGAGTWGLPGGHLEFGESVEACAMREVFEETGLRAAIIGPAGFTNDMFAAEGEHYVTLFVLARCGAGEPEVREPDKCGAWVWREWDDLPRPLFRPLQSLVDSGYTPEQLVPA
jgi:8-oxo-dGTP diphosphatase